MVSNHFDAKVVTQCRVGGSMPTCPAWTLFMSSLMSCHFGGGLIRISKAAGTVAVVALVDTGSEKKVVQDVLGLEETYSQRGCR